MRRQGIWHLRIFSFGFGTPPALPEGPSWSPHRRRRRPRRSPGSAAAPSSLMRANTAARRSSSVASELPRTWVVPAEGHRRPTSSSCRRGCSRDPGTKVPGWSSGTRSAAPAAPPAAPAAPVLRRPDAVVDPVHFSSPVRPAPPRGRCLPGMGAVRPKPSSARARRGQTGPLSARRGPRSCQ